MNMRNDLKPLGNAMYKQLNAKLLFEDSNPGTMVYVERAIRKEEKRMKKFGKPFKSRS